MTLGPKVSDLVSLFHRVYNLIPWGNSLRFSPLQLPATPLSAARMARELRGGHRSAVNGLTFSVVSFVLTFAPTTTILKHTCVFFS